MRKKAESYRTTRCNIKNCKRINCNFAHSFSELRIIPCKHYANCQYFPSCKYLHPSESKSEYFSRRGINNPFL